MRDEMAVGLALERAALEVLETMFFTSFEEAREPACRRPATITTRLSFQGELQGEFQLSLDPQAARLLAQSLLGLDESELSAEHPPQVAGELANMICGNLLSHLDPNGLLLLASPVPVEDSSEITGAVRKSFELPEGFLSIECRLDEERGVRRVPGIA